MNPHHLRHIVAVHAPEPLANGKVHALRDFRRGTESSANGPHGLVGQDQLGDLFGSEALEVFGQLQRANLLVEAQLVLFLGLPYAQDGRNAVLLKPFNNLVSGWWW